jgi:hypothetical protein
VGELVLNDKYVVGSPVYRDWRRWAISNKGGIALDNAINKIAGKSLIADWYGDKSDPYVRKHTFEPTEELVTFCGIITGTTLSYDIDSALGVVGIYADTTPQNEETIKTEVKELISRIYTELQSE